MPGVVCRVLSDAMLLIRTKVIFILFYDFYMVDHAVLSYATLKRIKLFRKYIHVLLFNY